MQIDMRRVDPSLNMNRFYSVELTKDLFGQHGVHRQWGALEPGAGIATNGTRHRPRLNLLFPIWSSKSWRAAI